MIKLWVQGVDGKRKSKSVSFSWDGMIEANSMGKII